MPGRTLYSLSLTPHLITLPMTAPTSLHPLLTIVTFIMLFNNGHNVGTASGFFYKTSDHSYFVTARHVVQDRSGARKYLMSNQPALDLIAVPLDNVDLSPYVINWVNESDLLPERFSLMPGESVIVPGFPYGIGNSVHAPNQKKKRATK